MGQAVSFYTDPLGFAVVFTNGDPTSFAVLKRDGAEIHLGLRPERAGLCHAHIMVDDVEALHERLIRAGARILQPPKIQSWGLRDMVIADPDGNTFEFAEPVNVPVSA
jgi:catechol 2,3-dioxygenase-like lactoylglutathione lyase family enzyme